MYEFRHTRTQYPKKCIKATDSDGGGNLVHIGTRKEKEESSFHASLFFFFSSVSFFATHKSRRRHWWRKKIRKPGGFAIDIWLGWLAHSASFSIKDKRIPKFFVFPSFRFFYFFFFKENVFGWVPTSEESVADTLLPPFFSFIFWVEDQDLWSSRTSGPPLYVV